MRRRHPVLPRALLPAAVVAALAVVAVAAADELAPWGEVREPSPGPGRIVGTYGAGCIAGAVELTPEGTGYQAVELERRRHFGHPRTIDYVERLGRRAAAAGLGRLLIGDIAQPRGGPMSYGHISHQTGLDVDVWFRLDLPLLPRAERAGLAHPSVLDATTGEVDPQRWGDDHARLLRLAASDPRVARIFVAPAIKRDLCARPWPERDWLQLVRPWVGHDDHMHVRLTCPPDAPDCMGQAPPPAGDGCGAELEAWLGPAPPPVAVTSRLTPPPACRAVLAE